MPPESDKKNEPTNNFEKKHEVDLNYERVQVDGKIYNATELSNFHPGGDLFVKVFSGLDATEAFLSYHRKPFPHQKVTQYLVGDGISKKNPNADKDYLELCKIIEQVLPQSKSYAPWYYYIKVFVLIAIVVSAELYFHMTATYKWYLCAPLGLFFGFIGMNIQHDANHGAISRKPFINKM